MATVQVKTNAADVARNLMGKSKKVAQAAKAALSKTILQVQHAERVELNQMFTVRKAAFMRNRIKITQFPTMEPGGLVARIAVSEKVSGSKLLLPQFENGGQKEPASGTRVAIPLTGGKARPAFRKGVPASMRLDRLGLHSQTNRKGKGGAVIGNKRTFILPTKRGEYVLMQRSGKGGEASPLYIFRNRVTLKRRMKFFKDAERLAGEQLPKLFNRYLKLYIKD